MPIECRVAAVDSTPAVTLPQIVQTAPFLGASDPQRVWTLNELDILQDMAKPIAVLVNGVYEDPHRYPAAVQCQAAVLQKQPGKSNLA